MIKRIFTVLFSSILLFGFYSCGEKKETPKLQYYKETPIQGTQTIFYRPDEGVLADVIPYYEDGKYYLYFLHDYRNVADYGVGVDWDLLVTSDFITYDYKGTVLRRGSTSQQDNNVFTGSIIQDKTGLYHIFYTGNNAAYLGSGKPKEAIMHAVSEDKLKWRKIPEDTFYAPANYMSDDWRDPYVYYDETKEVYKMLLAARVTMGPEAARGVTAVFKSSDLKNWTEDKPIYAPGKYHTHECPDLFKMGEWWYLIFSEFSDRVCTRYVMSKDLENWVEPKSDMFDGRGFYAAKSAGNDTERYLFGWIPTKQNDSDGGSWEWGGNLAVHKIYQREDGTLGACTPETVIEAFTELVDGDTLSIKGTSGKSSEIGRLPERYKLGCVIEGDFLRAGFAIEHSASMGYRYIVDKEKNTLSFENYPSKNLFGDVTVPISAKDRYELTLLVEGQVCTAYINGEKALSARVEEKIGNAAFYVEGGVANFEYTISTLPEKSKS